MSGARVEGTEELNRTLAKLAENVSGEQAMAVLVKAAKPLEDAMKRTGAFEDVTGNLRRSIGTVKRGRSRDKEVRVGATAPHAHLIEFGTGPRRQKSGRYTGVGPKRPFMRQAYDATRAEVLRKFRQGLKELTKVK